MTYDEWKAALLANDQAMDRAAEALKAYPRGDMGLTPDAHKDAAWWRNMAIIERCRTVRLRLHRAYKAYSKQSAKESAAARDARRAAMVAQ